MRVHLRQRRQKNGKISLYLEIYKGYLKTNNKTKAIRDYEYLNLYLYNLSINSVDLRIEA